MADDKAPALKRCSKRDQNRKAEASRVATNEGLGLKQCSKRKGMQNQCKAWFSINDKRKTCQGCRDVSLRYAANPKGKANRKRYQVSDKGRACNRRQNERIVNRIAHSLRTMVSGNNNNPQTFIQLGIFKDNDDAQKHFELQFAPWMNWINHGKRLVSTLPNTRWNIGHRIPKTWYRHDDLGEILKCWSRGNLFPQCAVENTDAKDRNIFSREEWVALKPIWPKQCAGMADEQAWQWAFHNVDNATRKAARAEAKEVCTAGPSTSNVTFNTGSDSDSDIEDWFTFNTGSDSDSDIEDWF